MALLEKLRSRVSAREAVALDTYAKVVRAVATDAKVKPETIEAQLAAAGKTVDDLAADVERFRERAELIARRNKAQEAVDRAAECEKQIEALREQRRKLVEPIDQEVKALREESDRQSGRAMQGMSARNRLVETVPGWLTDRLATLRQERLEAQSTLGYHERAVQSGKELLAAAIEPQPREKTRDLAPVDPVPAAIDGLKRNVANSERMVAETRQRLAKIEAEIGRLQEQQYEPWPVPAVEPQDG